MSRLFPMFLITGILCLVVFILLTAGYDVQHMSRGSQEWRAGYGVLWVLSGIAAFLFLCGAWFDRPGQK